MARLGSGHFQRRMQTATPVEDGVVVQQQRKVVAQSAYPVDRMCQLMDNMVAKLTRQIDAAGGVGVTAAPPQGASAGQGGGAQSQSGGQPGGQSGQQAASGRVAVAGDGNAAPMTLGESLQRMLLPPDLSGITVPAGLKLSPDQCRHILAACSKLLQAPMSFDPSTYNKVQPGSPDAIDHDPTIPQTYLKYIAAALTLVVGSLPPAESRVLGAILESTGSKIQELDPKNLGPQVVASKPGDKMSYALGIYFPPNPMSPPMK